MSDQPPKHIFSPGALADLERKHGCAAPAGSARTCEWETVAPPKICGMPAVFATQGKYICQNHGDGINRRWPGAAKLLQAPNDQAETPPTRDVREPKTL
jgi:hypothetical protein